MTETDGELALRARAGRREAFDALVERHGPTLFTFLRRMTRRLEDAQDLFQETFLRAFRELRSLRDPHAFRGWLVAIASNAVRRHVERSASEWRRREPAEGHEASFAGRPDPLESDERAALVRGAIARLPLRQREVLSMRLDLDLPFREIARALDIREDNARAHHYQAMRSLRRMLQPTYAHAPGPGDAHDHSS